MFEQSKFTAIFMQLTRNLVSRFWTFNVSLRFFVGGGGSGWGWVGGWVELSGWGCGEKLRTLAGS